MEYKNVFPLSDSEGNPQGFNLKAIVSVNAFDVAASGSSNSVEVVITPVADTPSPSVALVDAQGSAISNKTIDEDTSGILNFDVTDTVTGTATANIIDSEGLLPISYALKNDDETI